MNIEHVAFNVKDPVGMARWYVANLGMRIVFQGPPPQHGHFLADQAGRSMVEIYHNHNASVPDYASMDPAILHLAFSTDEVEAARQRLLHAGATPAGEVVRNDAGDVIAIVRDPWGLPVQLVRRGKPLL